MATTSSASAVARSNGTLRGGSKGSAATPAIGGSAQSPVKTETAAPSATGSMRRSHGAPSVSRVSSSSCPATRSRARSHVVNGVPIGDRGEQHALGRERAERHGGDAGERVRGRDRGEQRLVSHGDRADTGRPWSGGRLEHDRGGELPRGDPAQQLGGHVLDEQHVRAGERLRQPAGGRPAERAMADGERGRRARAARLRDGEVELGDRAPGASEQRGSRGGQLHPPRRAYEQDDSEIALELADRARERRLRHVQPLGGAAEVQLLGHRDEVAQLAQLDRGVHAAILRR